MELIFSRNMKLLNIVKIVNILPERNLKLKKKKKKINKNKK